MSGLTFLLLLAQNLPAPDPALDVRLSFEEPYLSMSRFGDILQKETHTPVSVDPAIADRKVSVFCENKPLGEVLQKVRTLLFLDWTKDKYGYHLIYNRDVAREEALILADQHALATEALKAFLEKRIALTSRTPEQLQIEAKDLETSLSELSKDTTEAGKERYREAQDRYMQIYSLRNDRTFWDDGYMAAQMTPTQTESLLGGQTIFASTVPRPGMLKLLPEALTKRPYASNIPKSNELLVTMRYDPTAESLTINHRTLGDPMLGSSLRGGFEGASDGTVIQGLAKEPLVKRLNDWAKVKDESVMTAPLNREAKPPVGGMERVYTLADNLRWLHDRTGVPIVADAYRRFASFDRVINASNIKNWWEAFKQPQTGQAGWLSARIRTEGGWLMMRERRYWQFLAGEVPERVIAPLEAKFEQGQLLTLEDYSGFAAQLSAAQENTVESQNFIVHFSAAPLYGNIPVLRLWSALPSGLRRSALAEGVSYGVMPPDCQTLYATALQETLWVGLVSETVLPYFFPQAPPLPNGLGVFVRPNSEEHPIIAGDNHVWFREGLPVMIKSIPYIGFRFVLGRTVDSPVEYRVPLAPIPPKQ